MKLSRQDRDVLFALMLNPLPPSVRGALLADEAFCKQLGLKPTFFFPLGQDLAAETRSLNNVLRAAVSDRKSALLKLRGGKQVRVRLERKKKEGTASFVIQKKGFSFNDADLLSSDKRVRSKALDRVFAAKPLLPSEQRQWRSISEKRAYGDREYVELMTSLGATPEGFHEKLSKPRDLNADELTPDVPGYYHLLAPPVVSSTNFEAYIDDELASGRRELFDKYPRRTLRRIAFAALWQNLVPFELLSTLRISDVASLLSANDPFSLLCGFELCRERLSKDSAFSALGESFLQKLFLDPAGFDNHHYVFSACSLISTVNVRRAARASGATVFWARLAALAHAGVLTDALVGMPDGKEFFRWATQNFYPSYAWHCAIDRRDAPRWRPDWISPDHLYAELVGRALGVLHLLPEPERPSEWVDALASAQLKLKDMGKTVASAYPGPFDDFRDASVSYSSIDVFNEIEEMLDTASTLDIPGLYPLAHTFKPSERLVTNVLRIVGRASEEPITSARELHALRLCAHVAAVSRHEALAHSVINRCLGIARRTKRDDAITDVFEVVVEACAAWSDQEKHRKKLGEMAANLCIATDDEEDLANLAAVFKVLTMRDERLTPALARARSIVRARTNTMQ